MSGEVRAALARLPPDDPIRPLVSLALEDPDPALVAAVARRLLAEIRAERASSYAEKLSSSNGGIAPLAVNPQEGGSGRRPTGRST